MDPVSALGLASAIVALVDFSSKLLTGAFEIHQSLEGVAAENAHLEDVTGRLESLMQALTADIPVKTTAERNILHLAKECKQDAEALRALLAEIKVPGRRRSLWKSLNASWKSILNKREVAELRTRIQESRTDIQMNIISMLKEDQSTIGLQLTKIEQDCNDLMTGQQRQLNELKAELLNSLRQHGDTIQQQLQDMQRSITTISMQHRILRRLLPDGVDSRQDQILEADPQTCNWILEPAPYCFEKRYQQEIHEDFVRWLRTGEDVLHISGNPGSGKSTLMKFIAGNSMTQEALRAWAGNKQLIFAQFYLWIAGTEAQRTLPGMLRSLLFQVLSRHPDLVEAVFPSEFKHMRTPQAQFDHDVEKLRDFNSKKIYEAFDLFLIRIANSEFKVFFLIDGLDELEGGELDHEELAEKLKSWTTGEDIKLLVSSRPWRPFLTTFTANRVFHLHELNHDDIKTYAINQLRQDREIRRIGVDQMMTTIQAVVEELCSQAQGIFLWAHLVLESVRQGIRRQYSVNLLKAKVWEYPSDLDDLYDALREPIEKSPIDKKLSNRMLLLAVAAPKDFPLHTLAFSWLPEDDESGLLDPSFPQSIQVQPYSTQEIQERLQCVAERINGLTRGLLEPVQVETSKCFGPEVRFCHRTARDYLITNVKRYSALEESWPGFHQSDPYGRIYLADLIYNEGGGDSPAPFCLDCKSDTIRKFEEPMRPSISDFFSKTCPDYVYHFYATIRFLRDASSCRLDSFALYEITNHSGACLGRQGMNIFLSHALGSALSDPDRHYRLALDLLRIYLDRDIIVEADVRVGHYPVEEALGLHPWIIALIVGLQRILGYCSRKQFKPEYYKGHINNSLLELCYLLNELAVKLAQKVSVTINVEVYDPGETEAMPSSVDGTRTTLSAAELLKWAGSLAPGVLNVPEYEGTEEKISSGWVSDIAHAMREENFPGANYRYRLVSWNLDSTSGSIDGTQELKFFDTPALMDFGWWANLRSCAKYDAW